MMPHTTWKGLLSTTFCREVWGVGLTKRLPFVCRSILVPKRLDIVCDKPRDFMLSRLCLNCLRMCERSCDFSCFSFSLRSLLASEPTSVMQCDGVTVSPDGTWHGAASWFIDKRTPSFTNSDVAVIPTDVGFV